MTSVLCFTENTLRLYTLSWFSPNIFFRLTGRTSPLKALEESLKRPGLRAAAPCNDVHHGP